ncbi:putative envelope protein [Methanosarcina spherical virus]|nr:putative envelope protein [Methanosarcina spherical virus]
MSKNLPSIYYVYANKTYEEEIKAYLIENFSAVGQLNISNSSGCGFKIESYDIGDLRRLDAWLEGCEGWIQSTRRNEFNELETNLFDLDKYVPGCDRRLSTDSLKLLNFTANAFKGKIALRTISFLGSAVPGSYNIRMGSDNIKGSVPANASATDNRLYLKTLKDTDEFELSVNDCTLSGVIVEMKGRVTTNWTCSNPLPTDTPIPNCFDGDIETTYEELPYDNYPRMVINCPDRPFVRRFSFRLYIDGTSGDTFKFTNVGCYAFDAQTGKTYDYSDQLIGIHALAENFFSSFYINVNQRVTQLRFTMDSVEHPYPAKPSPEPKIRIYQIITAIE